MMNDPTYRPPPVLQRGLMGWLRVHLFATPLDVGLTLGGVALIWLIVPPIIDYLFIQAFWTGSDGSACTGRTGFCWPFLEVRLSQFIYGTYLVEERWRVDLAAILGVILALPTIFGTGRLRTACVVLLFGLWPIVTTILLTGGMFGLVEVPTNIWGGFLVTLVVALFGIAASLPLGIALALARLSDMPFIRWMAIAFIEIIRGVPLITILFMASLMLPIFLPNGVNVNGLLRVLVGFSLFAAAYMAEIVRAGLSALPQGQSEAAKALGLGYWHIMGLILLPQALRLVLPNIVNTFIALFKDTTLVMIVGIMDLLGVVQAANNDPVWAGPNIQPTSYVFVGLVFWISCYGMSRLSARLERRFNPAHRGI
jgi:general L-amino acid transport system permease protein